MRINKMITKGKMRWSFIPFSELILKENVWKWVWRICMWIWDLKGLIIQYFMLITCIGQNWISASLTGFPVSNFSYFALLRSISSHFSLISVLTVTADVHVEHSAATNDFIRSVEQKKINGRMSFFTYIWCGNPSQIRVGRIRGFHFFWLSLWLGCSWSSENQIVGVGRSGRRINQSQCTFPCFVIGLVLQFLLVTPTT